MSIPVFAHVSSATYVIPVYFGIRHWRRLPGNLKAFALFCVVNLCETILEFTMGRLGIYNQVFMNFHQLIEFNFLMYLFHGWVKSRGEREAIQYIALGYTLVWIIYKFYFERPDTFSDVIAPLANFFFIIIAMRVLFVLYHTAEVPLPAYASFWIAGGVLLAAAGTILVSLFSNQVLAMGIVYFNALWHVVWTFNLTTNLCYARGLTCRK